MIDRLDDLLVFFERGGGVLWAIFALSILMWALILERYWFYAHALKILRNDLLSELPAGRHSKASAAQQLLHRYLTTAYELRLRYRLQAIRTLAATLPALGLLGTVSGMIDTFDVFSVHGAGNVRGMADGISQALLTTMAGLVTAVSGLYFSANLDNRAEKELARFRRQYRAGWGGGICAAR